MLEDKGPMQGRQRLVAVACFLVLAWVTGAGRVLADEASTAARFEQCRQDEPSMVAFLRRMPKGADLHNHLSGAIYADALLDEAVRQGMYFDPATALFYPESAPGRVSAEQVRRDGNLQAVFLKSATMRGAGATSGHDHFFDAFSYIASVVRRMTLGDLLRPVVAEAGEQNVQYLELMMTPAGGALHDVIKAGQPVDDPAAWERVAAGLQPAIARYVAAARAELDSGKTGGVPGVDVRYIFQLNRNVADPDFFAAAAAAMALVKADPRVVGVNMVGPEDFMLARTRFNVQMRLLGFLARRYRQPNITLHAGELTPLIAPLPALQSHIRGSIEVGGARRIGHGVAVAWDRRPDDLLRMMRARHVAVEICLTSNDAILGVRGRQHPIHMYRRAGVPLCISTDDEGVSRSNLTCEYVRLVETLGDLHYAELKDIVRNGLEYSFLPGESLYVDGDPRRLREGFGGVREAAFTPSQEATRRMALSERLAQQVRLERALVEFER